MTEKVSHEEVLEGLEKSIEKNPGNTQVWKNKGAIHYFVHQDASAGGDFDKANEHLGKAIGCFRKAIELDPTDHEAHRNLGWMLKCAHRHEESIESFIESIKINPNQPDVLGELAHSFSLLGDAERAEEAADLALEQDPEEASALYVKGLVHSLRGEKEEAEGLMRRAVEANPFKSEFFEGLGMILSTRGKGGEAKQALLKSVELNPQNYSAYGILSDMYLSEGKEKMAEDAADKSLRASPLEPHAMALHTKAYFHMKRKEYSDAEAMLKGAIARMPGMVYFVNNLIVVLNNIGKYNEAEQWRQYGLKIDPTNERLRDAKGAIELEKEALDLIRKSDVKRNMQKMARLSSQWFVRAQASRMGQGLKELLGEYGSRATPRKRSRAFDLPAMKKLNAYNKKNRPDAGAFNPIQFSRRNSAVDQHYIEGWLGLKRIKSLQKRHLT